MMVTTTISVQAKSIFKSKTFWVNAITFLVGLIAFINEAGADGLLAIPPAVTRVLLMLSGLLNMILRRFSDQPVRIKPEETPVPLQTFRGPVVR